MVKSVSTVPIRLANVENEEVLSTWDISIVADISHYEKQYILVYI